MAKVINIAGGGGCCGCDSQHGCECSAVVCARECRAKAGVATMCGHDEILEASVPYPKKYRTCTFSGTTMGTSYDTSSTGGSCSGAPITGTFTLAWSGAAVMGNHPCELIEQGLETIEQ